MKTEDLTRLLAQDLTPPPHLPSRMSLALLLGGTVAAGLFAYDLGIRPDLEAAMQTWRFPLKVVAMGIIFVSACWASVRLARPEVPLRDVAALLLLGPAILGVAVLMEFVTVPPGEWSAHAVGSNARLCLTSIPLLSLAPLIAVLIALRSGAPRSPALAGAVAGLLAGGLGATLYAVHCFDDSPFFVALWYGLGVAAVTLVGAAMGRWALRW